METTGRQALEARVLELEMRVPNLVALQERIDNVELSIARLAAIERTMSDGDRRAFDGDKRLLGLLDLLGTAWWEGAEGEALGGVPP